MGPFATAVNTYLCSRFLISSILRASLFDAVLGTGMNPDLYSHTPRRASSNGRANESSQKLLVSPVGTSVTPATPARVTEMVAEAVEGVKFGSVLVTLVTVLVPNGKFAAGAIWM